MAIDQHADDPDAQQRCDPEDQQDQIGPLAQARRHQERCDIGKEDVVRQDKGQHHEQHRANAR
ncbi:hypothetical protein D3C75_1349940 [compost metagenome]